MLKSTPHKRDLWLTVSKNLSQAGTCIMLTRKTALKLNRPGRILGRFIRGLFRKLFSTLFTSQLEVNSQACPPVLEGDKNIIKRV